MKYMPFDQFWRQMAPTGATLQDLAVTSYRERRASRNTDRKDMLSYMLSAKSENGQSLSECMILEESTSLIAGGSDSTAATLVHFVDLVSHDRLIEARLQKELDEAFPGTLEDAWVPLEAQTAKLSLLNATLKEVLRIRPTLAAGLERVTSKEGMVSSKYHIPAGVSIEEHRFGDQS